MTIKVIAPKKTGNRADGVPCPYLVDQPFGRR